MVGQDREEANRLQLAKWELTSRIRDESNVPNSFHFSRRSPLLTRFRPSGSRRGVGDDGCPFRKSYPDVMVVVPSTDPADAELADALGLHRRRDRIGLVEEDHFLARNIGMDRHFVAGHPFRDRLSI